MNIQLGEQATMPKILVTGGAGFVGSHLCEKLASNKENEVYSLDNYFTGSVSNHVDDVVYICLLANIPLLLNNVIIASLTAPDEDIGK